MFSIECTYAHGPAHTGIAQRSKTETAHHAAWRLFFANTTYPANDSAVLRFRGEVVAQWTRSDADSLIYGYAGPRADLLTDAASLLPRWAMPPASMVR